MYHRLYIVQQNRINEPGMIPYKIIEKQINKCPFVGIILDTHLVNIYSKIEFRQEFRGSNQRKHVFKQGICDNGLFPIAGILIDLYEIDHTTNIGMI